MYIDVQIVNAFIDGETGGNPAGVVVDANILTADQKLKVAQQLGLSETALVSASDTATIKTRVLHANAADRPLRARHHCHLFSFAAAWSRRRRSPFQRNDRWQQEYPCGG